MNVLLGRVRVGGSVPVWQGRFAGFCVRPRMVPSGARLNQIKRAGQRVLAINELKRQSATARPHQPTRRGSTPINRLPLGVTSSERQTDRRGARGGHFHTHGRARSANRLYWKVQTELECCHSTKVCPLKARRGRLLSASVCAALGVWVPLHNEEWHDESERSRVHLWERPFAYSCRSRACVWCALFSAQ